jgi:1,4-dihydroxy-2-naphthoyl-CoA hydrolase
MQADSEYFHKADQGRLPGSLGIRSIELNNDLSVVEMKISENALNFNGYIHGGSIVTLADTAAGYGCFSNLPDGASNFTTIELKCNFLGGVQSGRLVSTARCIHRGKSTQVWDATVVHDETSKVIGEFRCTQMILYPK